MRATGGSLGLLESMPYAVVAADSDGRIVFVNGVALDMFGYDSAELLGSAVEVLVPGRLAKLHADHLSGYLSAPRMRPMGAEIDIIARRKDGTEFPADVSLGPLETEDGLLVVSAIRLSPGADRRLRGQRPHTSSGSWGGTVFRSRAHHSNVSCINHLTYTTSAARRSAI